MWKVKQKNIGGHPYLAKLSNQVFLPHIKYDLSKLLPEYGEFNEMMGINIHGVPRRFQSSRWRKWPHNIQKSQNRCIFVLSVWKRHDKKINNKRNGEFLPATRAEKKVFGDDFLALFG